MLIRIFIPAFLTVLFHRLRFILPSTIQSFTTLSRLVTNIRHSLRPLYRRSQVGKNILVCDAGGMISVCGHKVIFCADSLVLRWDNGYVVGIIYLSFWSLYLMVDLIASTNSTICRQSASKRLRARSVGPNSHNAIHGQNVLAY